MQVAHNKFCFLFNKTERENKYWGYSFRKEIIYFKFWVQFFFPCLLCFFFFREGHTRKIQIFPSGVRALPLGIAAEQSVHYFWSIFWEYNHTEPEYNHTETEYNHTEPISSVPNTFLPEGFVLGLWNFANK